MSLFKRHWMFDCEIVLAQTWSAFAIRHGSHLHVTVGKMVLPHVNRIGPVLLVNGNVANLSLCLPGTIVLLIIIKCCRHMRSFRSFTASMSVCRTILFVNIV